MTVRWKPLLILSGLFVAVALGGLMSFALYKNSRGTADILARARLEVKSKQYEKAKLDYQRAIKLDNKNAALHEEIADLYEEWSRVAPADKKNELRSLYLTSLTASTKFDTKRISPRRRMLAEAIQLDDLVEQVRWSRDLVSLEPNNRDAHYILAAEALDGTSPNIPEVRRHLIVLETELPRRARSEWVAARTAALTHDAKRLDEVLKRVRSLTLPADADPVDRLALLRLRTLEVACTEGTPELAGPIDAVAREALFASSETDIPPTRIARVCRLIEEVQKLLLRRMLDVPSSQEPEKAQLKAYGEKLEVAAEEIFQKSLVVKSGADLNVYLAYADHLRFRERRDRCLVVVLDAFKSPSAAKQATTETAMGLHALAVEASLANVKDSDRYANAEPHIKSLLECKFSRYQALGHLFQGAIDLEKAGMVSDAEVPAISRTEQTKLRSSALGHLKIAAKQLPGLAEAQARYGVALILNQEPAMGRQYLQLAQRLGNLESQYQIWAAWSVVQAGYPEDAEPIVARMLEEVRLGRLPKPLEGTLHLLRGEIHQSRRSPADLKKAIEEYGLAFANGQDSTPAVELRLAQMEIQLDRPADALKRIDWLVSKGKGGPSAENLAVLTLQELKRDDDARKRLADARAKYPESGELAVLEASLLAKARKPEEADRVLIDFLAKVPDSVPAIQLRAQILVQGLNRPDEARKLLNSAAERSDNSSPLVQLALLDLAAKDFGAVSASIAKIRDRWKDAATGDLLDAQLSLARNDMKATAGYFDAALKKDPNNKIVQFWKAQLEGRSDPEGASKVFEALARGDSIKEVETGLSIATASQGALAGIALETGDLDQAIARYREMLKSDQAIGLSRAIRWQIVSAQVAKKEWTAAKAEINTLLKDPASPATPEELVKAATFFRLNKEDETALALADQVLKADPTYAGAVVTRAEILARSKKSPEAIATIQRAIDATVSAGGKTPPVFYLMMAAVETTTPPIKEGFGRALLILEKGIEVLPDSEELVQAKVRVLTITQGGKAALDFVEAKFKADPKGPYRKMLLTTYAEQNDFVSAERVAAEIVKENPTDALAAAAHVRMVAGQSIEAARKGNQGEARRIDEKASALIYDYRARFKNDWTFLQLECEVEIRRGDFTRALALTQELDNLTKNQAAGPLLRAQIFAIKGQTQEAAAACTEALTRNPRLPEARLQLARLNLKNGKTDEALRQARFLQDADPDKPTGMAAMLVETRAIATQPGTQAQIQANRAKAIEKLAESIRNRPDFSDAYYQTADVHLLNDDRPKAVAILKDLLKLNPDDPVALTTAIAIQVEPRGNLTQGSPQPASKEDIDQAVAMAKSFGDDDAKGYRMLAISNGFSRAGLIEQAIPWAEKAAAKLDSITARLNLGDLLLTLSEKQGDAENAATLQDRALAEFDRILTIQPNTVAAVNNKAWILHRYKHESKKALDLAQGLLQRVSPNVLPGEFYDTLGSIQEAMNRPKDAEESYKKGLGKLPNHPVLNLHMGALMANDPARSRNAATYLKVAQAGSDRLPTDMAADLNTLLKRLSQ
jgi:tetratricopeptide (TPR) repeat protein